MTRFLDLTNQIIDGEKNFAFFNTVNNQIIHFDNECVFDSKEDFIDHFENDKHKESGKPLNHYLNFIPENF